MIKPNDPLIGRTFMRRFRPDCAFERRVIYDPDWKCLRAEIIDGPLSGGTDPDRISDGEIAVLRSGATETECPL